MLRILADTFFAAGAREVFLPILGGPPGYPDGGITADDLRGIDLDKIPSQRFECASQHPLGSCRMGLSPDDAVVDEQGQVFGLRELFVVDSSILPTSLGVNPQVTVMAMATRLAWQLRERRLPEAA
jgi:choline dehydrogenase-like flavoprotein